MKKYICLLIVGIMFMLCFIGLSQMNSTVSASTLAEKQKNTKAKRDLAYNEGYELYNNYYSVNKLWNSQNIYNGKDLLIVPATDIVGGTLLPENESYGYGKPVVKLEADDTISMTVSVQSSGLYSLYLDYYLLSNTRTNPTVQILVNDETQYTEMNNIELKTNWLVEDELKVDRYGDQLAPKSFVASEWMKEEGLIDPNYFFMEPLKVHLQKGDNTITFHLKEGELLLGQVKIQNKQNNLIHYDDYVKKYSLQPIHSLITLEAENYTYKSRQSITAKYRRDSSAYPYSYKQKVLNVLDGDTFSQTGDRITYRFTVEETGLYQIALKYYHTNRDLPSYRRILIDGEVLFKELTHYPFSKTSRWKNEVLGDGTNHFQFYLTKGEHTLTLLIDHELVRDIYHELLEINQMIDEITTDITRLTGGLSDKDRDWQITRYLTDLVERLEIIDTSLQETIEDVTMITKSEKSPIITELKVAQSIIRDYIKEPEDLPNELNRFSLGDSSAYGRINTILPKLLHQPLSLDRIYIFNETELPKPMANPFVRFWEGLKAFFYSFIDPRYKVNKTVDDDTIVVWVNKSRLYVDVMQRMIDESFTPQTGIKVQLSLLPDESKVILSNAAKTTPDAAIGLSFQLPFELAIRDVIVDLREMPGYYDLISQFNPNTLTTYIYGDGVYAIPESQDVNLLFYRKDLLERIGVTPPETWDDVITLIPILQKYDMNFYSTIGNDSSFKGLDVMSPFIYQYGGAFYDPETMRTTINQGGAYQAFILMTDLFTVYNLPVTTSNFYQKFRNGSIPIGIGDLNMYLQLKYAAPEIAGQWDILPIPGIENEDGVIERWDPTYGSSSVIFKSSQKQDKAWELIRWWSSAEQQAEFSYELQATLGEEFLYLTANIEGFKQSAWSNDLKQVVLEQWTWIEATGKVPGDYMLERELSNAWNRVVYDGINPRIAIDEAIRTINQELRRKLNEFGYMDEEGNILKPYLIPTRHNIERWVSPPDEE